MSWVCAFISTVRSYSRAQASDTVYSLIRFNHRCCLCAGRNSVSSLKLTFSRTVQTKWLLTVAPQRLAVTYVL